MFDRPFIRVCVPLIPCVAVAAAVMGGVQLPTYEVQRSSFPAGAGQVSGGLFEVSFSIDFLPPVPGSGGDFTLTGGVWLESPPGDCVEDGLLALTDFTLFTPCLLGPASIAETNVCRCYDLSGDSSVDLRDFALFANGFGR